jgi:hypothetical protein
MSSNEVEHKIEYTHLYDNITDEEVSSISSGLKYLYDHNGLTDEKLKILSKSTCLERLKILYNNTHITPEGIRILIDGCKSLKYLELMTDELIDDEMCLQIARVPSLCISPYSIYGNRSHVSDNGFKNIFESKTLTSLSLYSITEQGCRYLAENSIIREKERLPYIKHLTVSNLGGDVIKAKEKLDYIANVKTLESLELYYVHSYTQLKNLTKLKKLSVHEYDCKIREEEYVTLFQHPTIRSLSINTMNVKSLKHISKSNITHLSLWNVANTSVSYLSKIISLEKKTYGLGEIAYKSIAKYCKNLAYLCVYSLSWEGCKILSGSKSLMSFTQNGNYMSLSYRGYLYLRKLKSLIHINLICGVEKRNEGVDVTDENRIFHRHFVLRKIIKKMTKKKFFC